jgi:hypothetical protein
MFELKVMDVILKNGEKLTGTIIPLYPAKFLVQTDDACFELSETEIQSVSGAEDFHNLIKSYNSAFVKETMVHQYNEDGSMISLHKMEHVNTSDNVLGKVRFLRTSSGGITKEFEELFNHQELFDTFGNLLSITIDERLENGWTYTVELPIPVPPGDTYEIITKDRWPTWATYQGDHWHTRHYLQGISVGGIYVLIFILPKRAETISVTPQPLRQFDFCGKPTITWKRYISPDEPAIFEATYKLQEN